MISFIIWIAFGLLAASTNNVFARFNFSQAAVDIISAWLASVSGKKELLNW